MTKKKEFYVHPPDCYVKLPDWRGYDRFLLWNVEQRMMVEAATTSPYDPKKGLRSVNTGGQRVENAIRPEKMAKALEETLRRGHMAEFALMPCSAETGVLVERKDGLHFHFQVKAYDTNHRRLEKKVILDDPESYPLSYQFLEQVPGIMTVVCNNGQDAEQFARDAQQLWIWNNHGTEALAASQRTGIEVIKDMRDLEEGRGDQIRPKDVPRNVICEALDQINSSNSLWKGRIDMDARHPGRERGKPIVLNEMWRTLDSAFASLVRSGDINPACFDKASSDAQVKIFRTVYQDFWNVIFDEWKEECSDPAKYVLMSKKGVKPLNTVFTAYLRYSRERTPPTFLKQYGDLSLRAAMDQPLRELMIENLNSMLHHDTQKIEWWKCGGGNSQRYGTSSKDVAEMGENLWMCMKPKYAKDWHTYLSARG